MGVKINIIAPMSISKSALLAEVEGLAHRDRVRRLVFLGRDASKGDLQARQTIAELHQSPDAFERMLALMTAFGSRDGALVLAGVSDVSRTVRRKACRMVAVFCDDTQVAAALSAIVEKHLIRRTLAALARQKRFAPVDVYLSARLKAGRDPAAIDVLAFGTQDLLSANINDFVEGGGPTSWSRLCARHPHFAAAWFIADLKRGSAIDARQRYRLYGELEGLARKTPDQTIALLQVLFDFGEQSSPCAPALARLVRSRPRETFDLLKARHERGGPVHPPGFFGVVRFDKVAHLLGPERLEYLIRHAYSTLRDGKHGVRWFLRLSADDQKVVLRVFLQAERGSWGAFLFRYIKAESEAEKKARDRAFDRFSRAAQGQDGTIAISVLDWLPADLRHREARRHLDNCATLVAKPERRIPYAGLLPFAEAKTVLAPWLGHPEGEERARAQSILISSVRHDRVALGDAIAQIKARKFEQDPVRKSMFEALAALRVILFNKDHLEAISGILTDALEAADLSGATASLVERLVVRLFRLDGVWGSRWLTKLFVTRGSVSTWGLGDGLTRPEAERLAPALYDLARGWATRERAGAILSLAQSLGIRLGAVTPILDVLEELTVELPFVSVSAAALGLLEKHDTKRFVRLVPALLAKDESFVLVPIVARFVSVHRQDLLSDRLLSTQPMKGRFATGRTTWIVNYGTGYSRWTARQQRLYASGLISILAQETMDVPTLRFAIDALLMLPFADATPTLPFASDPRQSVREMAVRGLPWLDSRQGVPVLIEALGDDRARWAIYALRKVFSEMRRQDILAALRAVPTKKVTVAKEVVRLLGELGGADAYQDLLRLDNADTHRDVKIALLRALWDHLDRPETWAIFERAVRDPDWIIGSKLADIPLGRLSSEAEERVVVLLSNILGRAEPEARLSLLDKIAYVPLRDLSRSLWRRLVVHMGTPAHEEAARAFSAVLLRMSALEVNAVVERLQFLLPRGQHLLAFLPVLIGRLGPYAQSHHKQIAEGLLKALKTNAKMTPHYINLGTRLWDWKQLGAALLELSKEDRLHYDAMEAALGAASACVHAGLLEAMLREQADFRLRRIGLATLISAASPKNGWTEERRRFLGIYQADRHAGVSGPASFVFPP